MTCDHVLAQIIGGPCPLCAPEPNVAALDATEFLALERSVCAESFRDFVVRAWPLLEPNGRAYKPNVASEAIIEHLQAVGDGKLRRLLVAVPPGSGKSTLCSIAWLPWVWLRRPAFRAIHASYADNLAVNLSRRARRLIESPWYRALSGIELRTDQNRQDDFENTRSGRRMSAGVDGALTGFRGDAAIVDDSLNAVDRLSKTTRERTNEWFDSALTNRLDEPERAPIIVIQQRLHSDDLIGHLIEQGGWEHLCLPAECDPGRRSATSIGWRDERKEGELLAPDLHPPAYLEEQRAKGSAYYSCVFQQNPTDDEGGLFLRSDWRFWKPDGTAADGKRRPNGCADAPAVPRPTRFDRTIISLDAAFKDLATSDNVAFLVIGAVGAERFVIDRRHGKMDFATTCRVLQELARTYKGATVLVEDKANGTAVVNALLKKVPNLLAINPEGGKESRAAAVSPAVKAGQVFLPEGAPWLDSFVEECAAFPRGKFDDQVDSLSQALTYLVGTVDEEFEEERRVFVRHLICFGSPPRDREALRAWLDRELGEKFGPVRDSDLPASDAMPVPKREDPGPWVWDTSGAQAIALLDYAARGH